jgi:hypothetical protein
VTATNARAFRKRRQRKDELRQLRQDHTRLLRALASAAEMTHDNHVYRRGWTECLKYIQAVTKKPQPRMPGGERARQSSFMKSSDAPREAQS